ncbi:thrombomodulin [Electrophorus electricus]|uniref:thrombomodulin n=1 Tax=Electrophorus electricus TaxID=8005 RepID=UPI0015D08330|nr:thrombomodulin [Electrophorus electricus]
MKNFIGVVMALALLRIQGKKPSNGYCVGAKCFTVYTDNVDFNSARKSCREKEGHLMTVRTTVADNVISDLLTGVQGSFWIGLRYTDESCSDSSLDLKGYSWITGDKRTNFTNWKSTEKVCSQRCVSLSKDDLKWTERHCNDAIEGYLCEHNNAIKCERLTSASTVLYETPLGFSREDLIEVPQRTNATRKDLGTKHTCVEGQWYAAPWNCEIYKGGCNHSCIKKNDAYICTCPPGYRLQSNAVSCSKAHDDPCLHASCSHECSAMGDDYECHCKPGFQLSGDRKTCKDINECDDDRLCPGENSHCVNTDGGFDCRCKDGFKKGKDTCEDYDECVSGPCEHICINTEGSYYCECGEGYKVSSEDKDKCALYCQDWECPAVSCDPNNPFQCDCPRGFIIEERSTEYFCIDIDECEMFYCDQICNNTAGGYICSCTQGFNLIDNTQCVQKEIVDGSSTTTTFDIFSPTSRSPTEIPAISAGCLLGITLCIIVVIIVMVCLILCILKHQGKIDRYKFHNEVCIVCNK